MRILGEGTHFMTSVPLHEKIVKIRMKAIESNRKRTGSRGSAQIYLFLNIFLPYGTEGPKEIKKKLHISGKKV